MQLPLSLGTTHAHLVETFPLKILIKCEHCDAIGHTSNTFQEHLKCDYYGWNRHVIYQCCKLKKARSNDGKGDYQDRMGSTSKANHIDTNPTTSTIPLSSYNLIAEQYHNMISLLNKNKSISMANNVGIIPTMNGVSGIILCASTFSEGKDWILDTDATDHMVWSP